MSPKKTEPGKPVTLQFVRDEDVDFCGKIHVKLPLSKPKKSLIRKEDEVDESTSKKISNSAYKSRSSTRLSKAPFSERAHFRKTEATTETAETSRNESQPQTPKRPRRVSKPEGNSFNDSKATRDSYSQFNEIHAETPRRISKRILAVGESKIPVKTSPLFTESPRSKRPALRSNSKISKKQSKISYRDESRSSSADECSLSDTEEIISKISSGVSTPSRLKKKDSNSIATSSKNVQKSNSNRLTSGFSTPKSKRQIDMKSLQTPAPVRKKIKNQFAAISRKVESDDESSSVEDLEVSADEFVPSSSEANSSENEEDSDSSVSETVTLQRKESNSKSNIFGKNKTIDVDIPYKVDADDYFLSKCSKEPTSNNQLSSLEVSHLEEDEIDNLLRKEYSKHETNMDLLTHKYKSEFTKWLFYLKENFNLLMYGLGSKIKLLECFQSEVLALHDILTIHGYFPRLLVKDILSSLITDVLKITAPKNASEALPVIESTLKSRKLPVFVVIHNVDRLLSRQRKQQSIISKLASFPNLHMIMTVDHINAPLLWGNSTLTELKLVWMNITTYQPYVNETSFENLIYLNEAGTDFVSLSSLRNIFKPLASRVKKIFQIIAKDRLENANNRQYKGMPYEKWYHRAKEELLVNNITVFKVQLTELIDHSIIKTNSHQCISILVKLDILDKFYKEMYGNDEE